MQSIWLRPRSRLSLWFIVGLVIVTACLLRPNTTQAHPLGNFSVNRYSRLEVSPAVVQIYYVLDMAEVPTFQEQSSIDTDSDGAISSAETERYATNQIARIQDNLHLTLNDTPAPLELATHELTFPAGQGGLMTLRLTATFTAPLVDNADVWQLTYRDDNFRERLGWQEIIAQGQPGVTLLEATVPAEDITNALHEYPEDLLQSPLAVSEATVRFQVQDANSAAVAAILPAVGEGDATSESTALTSAPEGIEGASAQFAALVADTASNPYAIGLALIFAFGLGAVHALSPGHGKTIVAAYLVGSRGTTAHALFLGLTTTIAHTIGVFALGLITLGVSEFILPEQLYPILSLLSGSLVLLLGLALLHMRWQAFRHPEQDGHLHLHTHEGDEAHSHTHSHLFGLGAHSHAPPDAHSGTSWRNLLLLGVSGGMLPCPSALIVLLSAVALGRVGLGLVLIVAFSLGLASVLTAIGVALVHARGLFAALPGRGLTLRILPLAGSLVVVVLGAGMLLQALLQIGLVTL